MRWRIISTEYKSRASPPFASLGLRTTDNVKHRGNRQVMSSRPQIMYVYIVFGNVDYKYDDDNLKKY